MSRINEHLEGQRWSEKWFERVEWLPFQSECLRKATQLICVNEQWSKGLSHREPILYVQIYISYSFFFSKSFLNLRIYSKIKDLCTFHPTGELGFALIIMPSFLFLNI